jgi:hypothetical protein
VGARKKLGRPWKIYGSVWKAGKRVRSTERTVTVSSEEELEVAERQLRSDLYEQVVKLYKTDVKDIKIEVETEVGQ